MGCLRFVLAALFGALLLAASCAAPSIDRRYEDFATRLVALTEEANRGQAQAAELADGAVRDAKLAEWQAVHMALVSARAAGALAYLNEDFASLARLEQQAALVVASCARSPAGNAGSPRH